MEFIGCAFKMLMGFDCPGCGLGHSILALMHGDFFGSVMWHPMGIVVFLMAAGWRWHREILKSTQSRQWVSRFFLFGFFVPWMAKLFW